ncbi:MAG: hypothetical protein ACYDBP_06875 [Leptospirales bacterium]|jgi:hypothetical protein
MTFPSGGTGRSNPRSSHEEGRETIIKEDLSMDVNKGAAGLVVVAIIMAVVWGGLSAYVGVNPFFLPTGVR